MRILSAVLPQRCVVCEQPGGELCDACRSGLTRLRPPFCERCGAPGPWPVRRCAECLGRRLSFAHARSAIVYDASARAFVRGWKERGLRGLAQAAAGVTAEIVPAPDVECIAAVPGDPERARERGDVPSRAFAVELGSIWRIPVVGGLARTQPRRRQRGLSLDERRRNARGSVVARTGLPARVCVVDDVYTSGATADACAAAAKRAGARHVTVVTFARAVR